MILQQPLKINKYYIITNTHFRNIIIILQLFGDCKIKHNAVTIVKSREKNLTIINTNRPITINGTFLLKSDSKRPKAQTLPVITISSIH